MDRSLQPNTTPFPDILTDQMMALLTGDEWKLVHYGVRYSLGHRSGDTITVGQFAHGRQAEDGAWVDRGCGLSEERVRACLSFLCDVVHLFLREDRPRKPLGYRLNMDLSSIDWSALDLHNDPHNDQHNDRHSDQQGEQQARARNEAPAPAAVPPPARRSRRERVRNFAELPTIDVRLDGSDTPLLERLHQMLTPDEAYTFDYLLRLAQDKAGVGDEDMAVWQVYRLWQSFGFRRLSNALQSPAGDSDLNSINRSCLVSTVAEMLESERFGQLTAHMQQEIAAMVEDYPDLKEWKEAIHIAVTINKRRLATVKTILKNNANPQQRQTQGDTHGSAPAAAPNNRRAARRGSEWTEEELRAAREAERGQDWTIGTDTE